MTDRRRMLALLLLFGLGACMGGGGGDLPLAEPVDTDAPYTLGSGDKLRIIVFGEQTLTGEYQVTGGGDVSFPLIGNIKAAGLTVEELQEALRTKLAGGYIDDPRVSAEIIDYRPFYILGEVQRPGQYPYSVGMTVDQAVAAAGGFTFRANTRTLFIKPALANSERVLDRRRSPAFPIRPGDTIRVAERFF